MSTWCLKWGPSFKNASPRADPPTFTSSTMRPRMDASRSVRRARRLLQQYNQHIGALRLLARGVAPDVAAPVRIQERDLATPRKRAANLLNMVPIFIILAAFIGGMHVAIDATAGERERGSLEPLLISPVSPLSLTVGKWLAAFCLSGLAVAASAVACSVALGRVPLAEIGLKVDLGAAPVAKFVLATLPVAGLATALQMLIATFARTYKEAQTYLSLLVFLPMTPGVWFTINPATTALWMAPVPILSQTRLLTDLIGGAPISVVHVVVGAVTTLAVVAGLLVVNARLLTSERIVFGT